MNYQEDFIPKLLEWFNNNKRSLSFRNEKDPYKIWISEIMAQQTQIDTLLPYFERFIQRFPDINVLANAEVEEVLKCWEGLGYYSRARNLHKTALLLHTEYNGKFPSDEKVVSKLPGIGPYTCGAILSIAFNLPIPAVDGNVLRVVTRLKHLEDDITLTQTKKKITQYLHKIIPVQAGDFNESLMELGALICTPINPKCESCPVSINCLTFQKMDWTRIPVKSKKIKQKAFDIEIGIVQYQNLFYLVKRPSTGLLADLWAFPSIETNNPNGTEIMKRLRNDFPHISNPRFIAKDKHVFTHKIWNMYVYGFILAELPENIEITDQAVFASLDDIIHIYPLPTAFSKLYQFLK